MNGKVIIIVVSSYRIISIRQVLKMNSTFTINCSCITPRDIPFTFFFIKLSDCEKNEADSQNKETNKTK